MEQLSTYFLGICILFILYMWHEDRKSSAHERKDLYDRLMSKDIEQYKVVTTPDLEEEKTPPETIVDLDDVKEDLLNG